MPADRANPDRPPEIPPGVAERTCGRCNARYLDYAAEPFVTCHACRKPCKTEPRTRPDTFGDQWRPAGGGWHKKLDLDPDPGEWPVLEVRP